MFKVNYMCPNFPSVSLFKIFKTKELANMFVEELGKRFVSLKII